MRLFSFAPFFCRWRLFAPAALLIALATALFLLSGAAPAEAQTSPVAGISGVTVADRHITVNLTGNRGTTCPQLAAWTVKVNGVGYGPTSGYCKSQSVELWLPEFSTPQIFGGMTVTLSYDKDSAVVCIAGGGGTICSSKLSVGGNEVASFTDHPVTNLAPHPTGATVNGKTLTITFDQALDEDSVPPGSAFRVSTFHGGGPGIHSCSGWCQPAVTAVALSGDTATLTLNQSIPNHADASVTFLGAYGANRLQSASGHPRKSYFSVQATVLTPNTPPVVQRATIGHHPPRPEDRLPAWRDVDLGPDRSWLALTFNEQMDADSLPPGSAFRVLAMPRSGGRVTTVAGTGALKYQGTSVVVTLAQAVERDAAVTATYVQPSASALQDRANPPLALESFTNIPANNGSPGVLSVALVSDAGPDRTYGRDETIRVQVTFTGPVEVVGTPRLRIILGRIGQQPGEGRWVPYGSGSGTPTLTFAYTVRAGDATVGNQGIALQASSLQLNGGSIRSTSFTPIYHADLSHPWLPYNASHKVDGRLASFQSAEAVGKTLTVTLNGNLHTGSVPAPGAFRVTVNGARRNVAAGGVAISGKTVTLTLASAVAYGDTVKVRYTRPSTNRLQDAFGVAVNTFADRAVTNYTPVDGIYWSATLTVKDESGALGCIGSSSCSTNLTSSTFAHRGETYRFTSIFPQRTSPTSGLFSVGLDKAWPQTLRDNAVLHVGSVQLSLSDAAYSDSDTSANLSTGASISGYSEGAKVSLRLTTGGFSGAGGNSGGAEPMSVTGVSVVSSAGADKTYGDGDRIEVRAIFDGPVDVTGTPRIKIDMDPADWGEKWAVYEEGGGTTSLTFVHTVEEPNLSTQGIAVLANTLELNGGAIRSGGNDANLAHAGLGHDANHKVDWQTAGEESGAGGTGGGDGLGGTSGDDPQQQESAPPAVSAVAVSSDAGNDHTYVKDDVISVSVTFDQPVTVTGVPRLKIDMDPAEWGEKLAAYHSGNGSNTLTFTYTVDEPNISTQGIALLANSLELNGGTIRSGDSDANLSHTGLAHNASHKVDWRLPVASVTGVSITSDPGDDDTYGPNDVITIALTFSKAVDVTGTPRLKIDMDPAEWGEKLAAYHSGNGSNTLTFNYTVEEPNTSTQGIAVLVNTLELNGGTIQSDGLAAQLAHTGLNHDAGHKVDWQQQDGGAGSDEGGAVGQGGDDQQESAPATVSAVAVSSTPKANATYGDGETIRVTLTFSEAVDVTGTPRLKIDMDPAEWGEKLATYHDGNGSNTLTFTYTVDEPNISTQGIAVLANTLELNGGTIQANGVAASLSHTGLAHNASHKVDWRLPVASVTGVSITSDPGDDDTYGPNDVITIALTFSKAVDVTGTPRLKIDMDPAEWGEKLAAYHSGNGSNTLTFTYTVEEPNISTQGIAVLANTLELNGGTIQSDGLAAQLAHAGLAHDAGHKVDWQG